MILLIPEILEAVLLNLPQRDLLHTQRVCRHWYEIITQSLLLQQKLFFQPIDDKSHKPEFNPLLQQLLPPFFLLTKLPSYNEYPGSAASIYEQDWHDHESRRNSVLRPEASWRRMLPVQPLAKVAAVVNMGMCLCGAGTWGKSGLIKGQFQRIQARGALMGLIYDATIHFLELPAEDTFFFIQWHMFSLTKGSTESSVAMDHDAEKVLDPEKPENTITIHVINFVECGGGGPPTITALEISSFDEDMIEFTELNF